MNKPTNENAEGLVPLPLMLQPAMKGRWVKQSRAEGKKLREWIIERVEARQMNVYPIPEALEAKYKGAGHALAAVTGGQLVDLVYLEDALPGYDPEARGALRDAVQDDRLGPTVRKLQALGSVVAGMCSSWEFVEL